jgi:hypothetical protein
LISKLNLKFTFKLYLDQKMNLNAKDFCYFESENINDLEIFSFFDSLAANKNIQKLRAKWLEFLILILFLIINIVE